MKEKLYTIPVNEVFEEPCFCPFCKLYDRLEKEEIRYAVGPAMMEPDYRAVTNEKGFCTRHMQELNSLPKALALSLVIDTHFAKVEKALSIEVEAGKKKLFGKKDSNSNIDLYIENIEEFNDTCAICDKINSNFYRYMDTFIFMLKNDEEFLNKVAEGEGFCMPHYTDVLKAARKKLSDNDFVRIISRIKDAQTRKFLKYKKDVKDFIESFDYKNAGKPLNVSGDTVLKSSYFLNGEFEKLSKKLEDV